MKINRFFAIAIFLAFMAVPARAQDALRWFWSPGLAIYASSINESLNQDLKLGRDKGLLVLAVARSGVGNQVGIKPGDISPGSHLMRFGLRAANPDLLRCYATERN